jgi:fructose-1-phosphate kinase PfkB-like protein
VQPLTIAKDACEELAARVLEDNDPVALDEDPELLSDAVRAAGAG